MFYRSLTISVDFINRQTLPQLPMEAFVMIKDGAFDANIIKSIIKNIDAYQEKADIGYDFARKTYKQSYLHTHNRAYNFTKISRERMFYNFFEWLNIHLKR